jgi:hypothetical protein
MRRSSAVTLSLLAVFVSAGVARANPPAPPPDPVRVWNELALSTVRGQSASDAQAARLFAMVNAAVYDAVNGIVSRNSLLLRRKHALVPADLAPHHASVYSAASAAAHAVLVGEFPTQQAVYDQQLAADLAALPPFGSTQEGRLWGAEVGQAVREARAGDGSTPNETQPAGSGPGQFRAAWSGVQFRNLAPFAIADPSVYLGAGPAPLAGLDYAAAFAEVKLVGDAAIPDAAKLDTFRFWSLAAGTSQPPGAWVQVALTVAGARGLEITQKARLLALVSMALADSVAPTVMTKFVHRHWRPATAIREADTDGNPLTDPNPTWAPRAGGIGTSPEYWSGHSSFSAAGAGALAAFFCKDDIPFSLTTDSAPGGIARTYPSFSAAAAEAGASRTFGGIHFRFGNEDGLAAGHAIAREVASRSLLRVLGPTHYGSCPF